MTTKRSNATSLKIFAFSSRPSNLFVLHSEKKNKKKSVDCFSPFFFLFHFVILYYSSEPYFIFLSHVRVCVCVVSTCRPTKKDRKKSISLSGGNGGEEQLIAKR
jgi:hypothetical protein